MAKNAYIGVGSVARKIKQPYVGIGGVARKVKNGYIGVGGVARQFYTGVDPTLNNNDWATISSVAASGTASSYWSVGDRKAVTISGTVGALSVSGTYYVYIIGFNHNGATNTIDFGTFKTALSGGTDVCLIDSDYSTSPCDGTKNFSLNHSVNFTPGGWKGCDLRYDVLGSTNTNNGNAGTTTATSPVSGTLMAALPSDLRAVMKPMTIYSDNAGTDIEYDTYETGFEDAVTTSIDYLPLLAEYEIMGVRDEANRYEQNHQAQYAYYSAGNSKIKYKHSATSTVSTYWLRSIQFKRRYSFAVISSNITIGEELAVAYKISIESWGIAPIFRV